MPSKVCAQVLKAMEFTQECQTQHCQYISKNILVLFKTENLVLVMILPGIWGIGFDTKQRRLEKLRQYLEHPRLAQLG